LNSDHSVRELKGHKRPLNILKDRLEVIAALEAVDFVTWFGEINPLKIILKLRPDILVKGGDWDTTKMVGAKEVLSWGGKVFSLPFIKGKSTTQLIKKIIKL
ncbi:MAG: D-glycero-beta-D-manno-heptose 1-phosphate adenylyltransferase, partial [Deltaproteobacteria bacterium]|nr:D-glycero-beta-D-manno-heptose 1-phosphate adenylyltransferase [Deltaproteobacteria bacterium]